MRPPPKFFFGLLAGFAAMVVLYAAAFRCCLGVPTESSKWAFEINRKKLTLAQSIQSPKLLLIGGSGTLFGISAQEIQRQTGWRTVNMGTHAALGTTYILRMAQQAAKPGDTVLLTLEYELYVRGKLTPDWADDIVIDYVMSRDLEFYHQLSLREKLYLFILVPTSHLIDVLESRIRRPPALHSDIYDVSKIDHWGDQMNHSADHRPVPLTTILRMKTNLGDGLSSDANGFPVIDAFCRWARTNHVRVLATFPNVCDKPEYHGHKAQKAAEAIEDFFQKRDIPVLGSYTECLLSSNEFFDTVYHLTTEAALQRSRRLATELQPLLKNQDKTFAIDTSRPGKALYPAEKQ